MKSKILALVGEERMKLNAGAKPLLLDAELTAAAQAHSEAMAKNRSFENDSSGNVAINALLADPKFRGFVGENAAAQYFMPNLGFDPDVYAKAFMDVWMMSPGHASNISESRFEKTGIGIAISGDTVYAAELFATDLGLPEPP